MAEEHDGSLEALLSIEPSSGIWLCALSVYADDALQSIKFFIFNLTPADIRFAFSMGRGKSDVSFSMEDSAPSGGRRLARACDIADWKSSLIRIVFNENEQTYYFERRFSEKWVFDHIMKKGAPFVPIFIAPTVSSLRRADILADDFSFPSLRVNEDLFKTHKTPPPSVKSSITIDLHWEALPIEERDDRVETAGEKKLIQLSYLEKRLHEARYKGIKKAIVIHGIGNGVLKREVRRLLKEQKFTFSFEENALFKEGDGGSTVVYLR